MKLAALGVLGFLGSLVIDQLLSPAPAKASVGPGEPKPGPAPSPGPSPGPTTVEPPLREPPPGGAAFAASLPNTQNTSKDIVEREKMILREVERGNVDVQWAWVESKIPGHTALIPIMRRALAVGSKDDRLIVSASFTTAQAIADLLGANLLTSRISDLAWQQAATRLGVLSHAWYDKASGGDGSMAKTYRMVDQAKLIEEAVARAGTGESGIVSNEGKDWVITSRNWLPPEGTGVQKAHKVAGSWHNGANFGWYQKGAASSSPGGERVRQSIGLVHGRDHTDYSQLIRLAGKTAVVDGKEMLLEDVARDPALYKLVSDEMLLPALRHPDLPLSGGLV